MHQGIVMVHTGNGKGKTTAALGLCMRMVGWGKRVCIIQFLKSPDADTGERLFCDRQGMEILTMGIGFSWQHTPQAQKEALQNAWNIACEKLADDSYDLIVLDEILGALSSPIGQNQLFFSEQIVMETLKKRPKTMDVALTGRNASQQMIDFADLVTEMKMIKHPYEKGVKARKGIEY